MENIPPQNFLFLLAYALDLDYTYLEENVQEQEINGLDFYEILAFTLTKLSKKLLKKGLYKSFRSKQKKLKRVRGKILFQPLVQNGGTKRERLECEFNELDFDILENKIILSTLKNIEAKLGKQKPSFSSDRKQKRKEITTSALKLRRLISSEVNYTQLRPGLFDQIEYNKANKKYKPVIQVCKLLYENKGWRRASDEKGLKIDEDKMSEIFEDFLRNYLSEHLTEYNIKKKRERRWIQPLGAESRYIPGIEPDIVVFKNRTPVYVIDAKFYEEGGAVQRRTFPGGEKGRYTTHSRNIYQLLSYLNFYNCDGKLVYAQTKRGHFEEKAKINPKHYDQDINIDNQFGFETLDLSDSLEEFKIRMKEFTKDLKSNI